MLWQSVGSTMSQYIGRLVASNTIDGYETENPLDQIRWILAAVEALHRAIPYTKWKLAVERLKSASSPFNAFFLLYVKIEVRRSVTNEVSLRSCFGGGRGRVSQIHRLQCQGIVSG